MGIFSFLFGKSTSGGTNESKVPRSSTTRIKWRDGSFPMQVVGESNYQNALIAICGPYSREGHDGEYQALIEREPSNRFDPNAVMVKINGRMVGYLDRSQAERVSQQMLEERISSAVCGARVRGGWRTNQYDEGSYGVSLAIPNHGWIDFGTGSKQPHPSKPAWPRKPSRSTKRPEAASSGPLAGHWVVLVGARSDSEIAEELAGVGAKIMQGLGKSTTLLVVAGEEPFDFSIRRSATFLRAEEMISTGARLRIVSVSEVRKQIRHPFGS